MIGYLKIGGAVAIVLALLAVCWKVDSWRVRAAELNRVQQEYAEYRVESTRLMAERDRQVKVNREISEGYLDTLQKQDMALDDARKRLVGLRLHVGPCPVPAAAAAKPAPAGANAPRADNQLPEILASDVASKFAQCDAIAARLTALQEWVRRQESQP